MIHLDDLDEYRDDEDCCDDPDCNCHRRPVETLHLPAEDVTR